MNLSPPASREIFDLTMSDGAVIRLRRHGNSTGPCLMISHGNGFAVDAYCPFWTLLLDQFDVVVFDLRNHGENPRHTLAGHDIPRFVQDFEELRDGVEFRVGSKPTVGIFHSISAVTAIRHAIEVGWRWAALFAIDPPLVPSPGHPLHELAYRFETSVAKWAKTRKDRFADPSVLGDVLRKANSRRRWISGTHELMAKSILRYDNNRGDWELRCPREYESQIYASNAVLDLCPRLSELRGPIKFIGADPNAEDAWAPAQVNRALHQEYGHPYTYIPDTSHMIHIERPAELAKEIMDFLARCNIAD